MPALIDLRSDTVTQPTPEMRAAMANAEVGDDVYGEDPTVNRLEQRAAEILGKEAALFVPTGSMGNQIALKLHTEPGQEVLCEARAHVLDWEMGMAAMFSGCQLRTIPAERGILRWEAIAPHLAVNGPYFKARTGLIWLENTHNMAGGTVTSVAVKDEICAGAHKAGLPVHLDGARLFNAATALGCDVSELARGCDTVNICLSKGLCAPVGSLLAGTAEQMARGRSVRKALGGGMRQAGVLAAAGLIALEQMPRRLHEDHAKARLLAELLFDGGLDVDPSAVETNILFIAVSDAAAAVASELKARGVLVSAVGADRVRLVTHRDVSTEQCRQAAAEFLTVASQIAHPVAG